MRPVDENPAMSGIRLIRKDEATREEIEHLAAGIADHARGRIGDPGFHPVAILAEDESGRIVGGVTGSINWTWLSVKLLWVSGPHRGRGVGRRLMEAIEDLARERGCLRAHVDTLAFQAPAFYTRLGYEPFAELPDYAPGHARIYLRKTL